MPSKGRWFILRTLSDRHASNPLVESHYISKLGSCGNALVLPHWCNIHQLNLCSSRTLRVNQAVVPLKAICVGLAPPLRHRESGGSAGCCRALKCRRGQARGTFLRIILLAQGFRQPANESCPPARVWRACPSFSEGLQWRGGRGQGFPEACPSRRRAHDIPFLPPRGCGATSTCSTASSAR